MSDKKITVGVEIIDANKTGDAAKEVEKAAERIEKAAEKAADAMGGIGTAAAGSSSNIASLIDQIAKAKGAAAQGLTPKLLGGLPSSVITDMARQMGLSLTVALQNVKPNVSFTGSSTGSSSSSASANPTTGWNSPWTTATGAGMPKAAVNPWTTSVPPPSFSTTLKRSIESGFDKASSVLSRAPSSAMAGVQSMRGWGQAGAGFGASFADMNSGSRQLAIGLGIATAAATGFTASMAPLTFSTLTQSVQLLGGEFARLLIPALSMASLKIQQVTGFVANLDEGTKGLISSTAMWAAPGMVALGVLGALVPVVRLVTSGVLLLGSAFMTAGRAAIGFVMTPWGAALTVAAVAVGVLTNGFGLLGDSIERAGNRADAARERLNRLQQPGAMLTRADFDTLEPALKRRIELTPVEQRQEMFHNMLRERRAALEQTQTLDTTRRAAIIEDVLSQRIPVTQGGTIHEARSAMIVNALAAAGFSRTSAQNSVDAIRPNSLMTVNSWTPEERRIMARQIGGVNTEMSQRDQVTLMERLREQGVPGVFQGLRTASPMQAQIFGSASDAYYSVMSDVLSRGQLEQDVLRKMMENTTEQLLLTQQQLNIMQQQLGAANNPPLPPPTAAPP